MNPRILCCSVLLSLSLILLGVGCGESPRTGPTVVDTRSMDLLGAENVNVEIDMKAGTLRLGGGAATLMDAEFTYNVEAWKPVVDYDVHEGRGDLSVRMPGGKWSGFGDKVKYEWDLRFNDDVPLAMSAELGAGESRLDLASLHLERLKVTNGAGQTYVDVGGNPTLEQLSVYTGAGEVEIDLAGKWDHDLDAKIKGGVGKITVRLPSDVGVRVDASKGIGHIAAGALRKEDGDYVNEAYGKSDITISIDIDAGIGEIILEPEDYSGPEGTMI